MKIYFDPKLVTKSNYDKLLKTFPQVNFISNPQLAKEAEVLIPFKPNLVLDIDIKEYPNLKWIQYFSAGYDGVDIDYLKENNIAFSNAQNVYSKAIAEDVFTKIFYFNRCVKYYIDSMSTKTWKTSNEHKELKDSTVLIVGVGSIGKELAKRFKSFEMNVIGYRKTNRSAENFDHIITLDSELDQAIAIADYVILAIPLNQETKHMYDKRKLNLMKKDALLINVARGQIINQDDLYETLKNRQIRGAGLDVLDPEPLPKGNPLWDLDNVFITPHNASFSDQMMDNMFALFISNIELYVSGKPVKYRIV